MSKLLGAVCGCGMISEFHLRAWQRIPEVEIAALCDLDSSFAAASARRYFPAARIYTDAQAMLLAEKELAFLDIATPPNTHFDLIRMAMSAGLHIACQKPLSDSLEQARTIAEITSHSQRIICVHENHRHRPWFQSVAQRCRAGEFGSIHSLRIRHLAATEPSETYKLQSAHGVWLEYGSHLVDMMLSLLGEPHAVSASMQYINPLVHGESLAHADFAYGNATAVIDTAWKMDSFLESSLSISGTAGEVHYEGSLTRGSAARLRIVERRGLITEALLVPTEEYAESFYAFQRAFADAMLGRSHMRQTPNEYMRTLEWTFAAYRSWREGKAITQNPA